MATPPLTSISELEHASLALSPAYDINPVSTSTGLSLNISTTDNALSIDLALEKTGYHRVYDEKATEIISIIQSEISKWESITEKLGYLNRKGIQWLRRSSTKGVSGD